MAECGSCGAIAVRKIDQVWEVRTIICECGASMHLHRDDFFRLHAKSSDTEAKLRKLLGVH